MFSGVQFHLCRLFQQLRVKLDGCDAAGVLAVPVGFGPAVCGQLHMGMFEDVVLEVLNGPLPANKKERILIVQHTHLIRGQKFSPNTVNDYMEALAESFVFYPVERFDIAGQQLLQANRKWYIVDLGLRGHILPRKKYDPGFSLENVVYFELLHRRYQVNIGKYGTAEVDFVAQKQGVLTYFQVTVDMTTEETFEREMRPLRNIRDNYEKIILTMDRFSAGNYDGIQVIHVLDWLMRQE